MEDGIVALCCDGAVFNSCKSGILFSKLGIYGKDFGFLSNITTSVFEIFKEHFHDKFEFLADTYPSTAPLPYIGEAPYIFISYSHKDDKQVWKIINRLQALYFFKYSIKDLFFRKLYESNVMMTSNVHNDTV